MKKAVFLLSMVFVLNSCVTAAPVMPHRDKKVVTVVSVPAKHVPPVHPKKTRRKKVIVVGTRVSKLPPRRVVVYCNDIPFYYAEGVFYKRLSASSYEVVRPEIGTVVPQLPDYDVETVRIDGKTLLLFDGVLYKQIPTQKGIAYKVTGFMEK